MTGTHVIRVKKNEANKILSKIHRKCTIKKHQRGNQGYVCRQVPKLLIILITCSSNI